MYKNYVANAKSGDAIMAEYLAKTDALYAGESEIVVKEGLRI